jgi:hypothetical protein
MNERAAVLVSAVAFLAAACARSSPSAPSSTDGSAARGQAVSAIDGGTIPGILVKVDNGNWVTPDPGGYFPTDMQPGGDYSVLVRGDAVVERQARLNLRPGEAAKITLIPASFDLTAYDEMMRSASGHLERWTTQPSLVIIGSVMQFTGDYVEQYSATSETLTDDEVNEMVGHLTEGLSLWTAHTYETFASVSVERHVAGDRVSVYRQGQIVVARYKDLRGLGQTIGYGTWAENAQGAVVGGTVFLDRGFDRDDPRRRLLRIHELGHGCGYLHVTSRTSVMNPAIGPEPTDFDRTAAAIAFQRPVGNVAPDTDPGAAPFGQGRSLAFGGVRWAAPTERLR